MHRASNAETEVVRIVSTVAVKRLSDPRERQLGDPRHDRQASNIHGNLRQRLFALTICQIIEQGHAIRLSPQADHARVRNRGVLHLE